MRALRGNQPRGGQQPDDFNDEHPFRDGRAGRRNRADCGLSVDSGDDGFAGQAVDDGQFRGGALSEAGTHGGAFPAGRVRLSAQRRGLELFGHRQHIDGATVRRTADV